MTDLQTKPNAIQIDCANIRNERQKINNLKVFNAIKERNMSEFYKNVNDKELERVLDETSLTIEELFAECVKEGGDLLKGAVLNVGLHHVAANNHLGVLA